MGNIQNSIYNSSFNTGITQELNPVSDIDVSDVIGISEDIGISNATKSDFLNETSISNLQIDVVGYDAIVGIDYPTLGEAVLNGKVKILIKKNTTETGNIAVPSGGLYFEIDKGITLNMGAYQFTYAQAADVVIRGSGTLQYAYSSANNLFNIGLYTTSVLDAQNIIIDNNSTIDGCYINNSDAIMKFKNVRIELPNKETPSFNGGNERNVWDTCEFVGGGSLCSQAFLATKGIINNLFISGTYKTSLGAFTINLNIIATNVYVNTVDSLDFQAGSLCNLFAIGSTNVNLDASDSKSMLMNCYLKGGTLKAGTGQSNCQFTNIRTTGLCSTTSTSNKNTFLNCEMAGISDAGNDNSFCNIVTVTAATSNPFTGNRTKVCNSDFINNSVTIAGNDNTFSGCKVGADAGGGTNTITINAGANRTIIGDTRTDAAIVDNGTASSFNNNVVY